MLIVIRLSSRRITYHPFAAAGLRKPNQSPVEKETECASLFRITFR